MLSAAEINDLNGIIAGNLKSSTEFISLIEAIHKAYSLDPLRVESQIRILIDKKGDTWRNQRR
jgi:hypothetical protein